MDERNRTIRMALVAISLTLIWFVLIQTPAFASFQRLCLVWSGEHPLIDWNFVRLAADFADAYVNPNLPEIFPGSGPIMRGDVCNPPLAMLWTRLFPATFGGGVCATALSAILYLLAATLFLRRRKCPSVIAGVAAIAVALPFVFAVQVGNTILLAAAATTVFLAFYDGKSRGERILAAVALAVAVAVKISPVVLGVLYLVRADLRRQLPYALLSAALGAVLLFGFFPFYGGLGGCLSWFANAAVNAAQYEFRNCIGLYGTFYSLGTMLDVYDAWYEAAHTLMHRLSSLLALICLAVAVFDARRDERDRTFLTVAGMLMLPPTMMIYTNLYLLPLLLIRSDRLSLVTFVALAMPIQLFVTDSPLTPFMAAASFLTLVLVRLAGSEKGLSSDE